MACGHVLIHLLLLVQAVLATSNLASHKEDELATDHALAIDRHGASTVQHARHSATSGATLSTEPSLTPTSQDLLSSNTNLTKASLIRSQDSRPELPVTDGDHSTLQHCICWGAVFVVLAASVRLKMVGTESLDMTTGALLCAAYVAIAATSDILVKWETQANSGKLPFAPARMVFVVEFLKLLLTVPVVMGRFTLNNMRWPSQEDSLAAMRLMFVPAMAYSTNNAIIYIVVSRVDFSSLTVWRQLTPLFVASIWVVIFRRQLGVQRWFALALLVFGTLLNSLGQKHAVLNDTMILVVLASCFTTAIAGVANEYVLKRCGRLDIDFLCCLLYVQTSIISFIIAVACESRPVALLTGAAPVVQANTLLGGPPLLQEPRIIAIILMQVLFGFAVARVIRYLGSVPRAIVNSLKELTVVCLAPVFTDSHINSTVVVSAIVAGTAAALFTLAPSPLPEKQALKQAWSPATGDVRQS